MQVVQETPCASIELPNEVGHSIPLETTMAVTRVRFPSPAPPSFNDLHGCAGKVQADFTFSNSFCLHAGVEKNLLIREVHETQAKHKGFYFTPRDYDGLVRKRGGETNEIRGDSFRRGYLKEGLTHT